MNCKYRINLEGIKGFYRVYAVNPSTTLYTFHKQLQADLEFPADQPILFKALDAGDNVIGRFALIDLGAGSVDEVSIASLMSMGMVKMVYFYDIASKKHVIISYDGELGGSVNCPEIIDSKGPLPIDFENGYVAFEDQPERQKPAGGCHCGKDDCDGDCDDEDDDNAEDEPEFEKEEEIYDENEA